MDAHRGPRGPIATQRGALKGPSYPGDASREGRAEIKYPYRVCYEYNKKTGNTAPAALRVRCSFRPNSRAPSPEARCKVSIRTVLPRR